MTQATAKCNQLQPSSKLLIKPSLVSQKAEIASTAVHEHYARELEDCLSLYLCLGHVWALGLNTWKRIFAPFSRRWWYCWTLAEPLCSQKAVAGRNSPHSSVRYKGPPQLPRQKALLQGLPRLATSLFTCLHSLGSLLFFETFSMNKQAFSLLQQTE